MPRVKLTPGRISALSLKDGVKQAFLWDSDTKPLAVRVTAGAKSFIFQARFSGKDIRITIGYGTFLTRARKPDLIRR